MLIFKYKIHTKTIISRLFSEIKTEVNVCPYSKISSRNFQRSKLPAFIHLGLGTF